MLDSFIFSFFFFKYQLYTNAHVLLWRDLKFKIHKKMWQNVCPPFKSFHLVTWICQDALTELLNFSFVLWRVVSFIQVHISFYFYTTGLYVPTYRKQSWKHEILINVDRSDYVEDFTLHTHFPTTLRLYYSQHKVLLPMNLFTLKSKRLQEGYSEHKDWTFRNSEAATKCQTSLQLNMSLCS